jgi:urea transport system permease protein
VIGAVGVNALKSWATRAFPDLWLLFLGLSFILVTVFMPKGIAGIPGQLRGLRRRFAQSAERPPADVKVESVSTPVAKETQLVESE